MNKSKQRVQFSLDELVVLDKVVGDKIREESTPYSKAERLASILLKVRRAGRRAKSLA